jgi:hypothetical protein
VDPKEAKLMQWHVEREKPEEDPEMGYMLTHPSDAGQWEALDIAFPRFGGDGRNIRLGTYEHRWTQSVRQPEYHDGPALGRVGAAGASDLLRWWLLHLADDFGRRCSSAPPLK